MPPVSILIADDHELVRKGIRTVLEARTGWQVVAEAGDGREAVKKTQELKPQVSRPPGKLPRSRRKQKS